MNTADTIRAAIKTIEKALDGAPAQGEFAFMAVDENDVFVGPAPKWINGHSGTADEHGRVEYEIVNQYLKTLPEKIAAQLPYLFYTKSAYDNAVFPDDVARQRCHINLSNRRWAIAGAGSNFEAINLSAKVLLDNSDNFDIPPESRVRYKWESHGFLERTISWNWDPKVDAFAVREQVMTMAQRLMNPGA